MFIPGQLIAALTFPGVIIHEIAHRFFCDIAGVPVYSVCYFQLDNPAGYVIHKECDNLKSSFLISIGPFILNTMLCSIITFSAVLPIMILDIPSYHPVFMFLMWLGFSIGMHAFPSNTDMENFADQVKKSRSGWLLRSISAIFVMVFGLANALRAFWIDAFYAYAISMLLPMIYFELLVNVT